MKGRLALLRRAAKHLPGCRRRAIHRPRSLSRLTSASSDRGHIPPIDGRSERPQWRRAQFALVVMTSAETSARPRRAVWIIGRVVVGSRHNPVFEQRSGTLCLIDAVILPSMTYWVDFVVPLPPHEIKVPRQFNSPSANHSAKAKAKCSVILFEAAGEPSLLSFVN